MTTKMCEVPHKIPIWEGNHFNEWQAVQQCWDGAHDWPSCNSEHVQFFTLFSIGLIGNHLYLYK